MLKKLKKCEPHLFDIQNYSSFIAAILTFQAIPGAGTIAILDSTARNGRKAGLASVIGTLLGDFVYMSAAALGLAAILQSNAVMFLGLQWFGVCYLFWIGTQLIFRFGDSAAVGKNFTLTSKMHFRKAFIVSLTNPKVVLFFVGFFPLFLKPNASALTLPAMMVHVSAISLAYQSGLVFIGNMVAKGLSNVSTLRQVFPRIAGFTLIALSVKLALSTH